MASSLLVGCSDSEKNNATINKSIRNTYFELGQLSDQFYKATSDKNLKSEQLSEFDDFSKKYISDKKNALGFNEIKAEFCFEGDKSRYYEFDLFTEGNFYFDKHVDAKNFVETFVNNFKDLEHVKIEDEDSSFSNEYRFLTFRIKIKDDENRKFKVQFRLEPKWSDYLISQEHFKRHPVPNPQFGSITLGKTKISDIQETETCKLHNTSYRGMTAYRGNCFNLDVNGIYWLSHEDGSINTATYTTEGFFDKRANEDQIESIYKKLREALDKKYSKNFPGFDGTTLYGDKAQWHYLYFKEIPYIHLINYHGIVQLSAGIPHNPINRLKKDLISVQKTHKK